jgi:hypothetical protein
MPSDPEDAMRRRTCLVTLPAFAFLVSAGLEAQQVQRDRACPTSRQVRQAAEAADSYYRGERVWVVVECSDTGQVIVATTSEAEAQGVARVAKTRVWLSSEMQGKAYEVAVLLGFADGYTPGCVHDGTSNWGPRAICGERVIRRADVEAITLQYKLRNGQTIDQKVPLTTDVLFLQYSGIEKFAFPYYERVLGLDAVVDMRNTMVDVRRRALGQRR